MEISLKQTPLIRQSENGTENLLRITLSGFDGAADVFAGGVPASRGLKAGETAEVWIKEPEDASEILIRADAGGSTAEKTFSLRRPEHYTIWIEQHSHHDPGYTDLMSHVFRRHCEWIDAILDEMDKRDGYPEDARLRIVFELRDNVMTAETSFIGQKAAKPMTDEEREVAVCIIKALCEDADIDVTDGIIDRITLKVRGGDD